MYTRPDPEDHVAPHLRSSSPADTASLGPDGCIKYEVHGRRAHITFNRPKSNNAIGEHTPKALFEAVELANQDSRVHVIILQGCEGKYFCTGYDLKLYAEEQKRPCPGSQAMPWDPTIDYKFMNYCTQCYMSLWRSYKPVIAKVRGFAVGGGSDIALLCDLIVMEEDARIGYPPARLWGCPTTGMWVYRVGLEKAKRMLLTGDLVTGKEAAAMGLVHQSVPSAGLDDAVDALAKRIETVPQNQLMMQKMMINQAYENMGLHSTQMVATVFDGITRHSPEGIQFKQACEDVGFKKAVMERDRPTAKL